MKLLLASEFSEVFDKSTKFFPNVKNALVTVINTASIGEGFDLDYKTEIQPFENIGYQVEQFNLAKQSNVEQQLQKSDICYVAGGNTFYLLEYAQEANLKSALESRFDDDFLYIGSSAGSIICSPDIDFIAPMDDRTKANLRSAKGLDLISFSFLPHVNHETMGKAADEIINNYDSKVTLMSFTDSQAIYVEGNKVTIL